MPDREPDLGGLTVDDQYRALRIALKEAADLALDIAAEEGVPEFEPISRTYRAHKDYIAEQVLRIAEQARGLVDHLDNLDDVDFVHWQLQRRGEFPDLSLAEMMGQEDAERGEDAAP